MLPPDFARARWLLYRQRAQTIDQGHFAALRPPNRAHPDMLLSAQIDAGVGGHACRGHAEYRIAPTRGYTSSNSLTSLFVIVSCTMAHLGG